MWLALLSLLAAVAVALLRSGALRGVPPPRLRRPLGAGLIGLALLAGLLRQLALAALLAAAGAALLVAGGGGGARAKGGASTVRSDMLEMTLDHETGEMDGRALAGEQAGRRLSEMSLDDLLRLAAEIDEDDGRSLALLRSYLDRAHPGWREAEGRAEAPSAPGAMTRETAYAVLGLEPGADAEAVRAAHRRLMKRVHPDVGGSEALAAQINRAKDLLLRG